MTDILLLIILIVLVGIWLQGTRWGKALGRKIDKWIFDKRTNKK
jgi:hypothetical protein